LNTKILVACIGNMFLGDDGFGVEMAKCLAQRGMPEHVTVVDFGIRSYDLAYALMQDWELVILVDALRQGGRPGTLYVLEPTLPNSGEMLASLDAHTMNPVSVLQLLGALGGRADHVRVVGCEPETVEPREDGEFQLSTAVRNALDGAVQIIEELIATASSQRAAA
jgi:hydrogenase maturation protease